jgi:hypothetical protein
VKLNQLLEYNLMDVGKMYTGGDFNCDRRKLTSLKGAPNEVDGNFYCNKNALTSLEGGPTIVKGGFNCGHNKLTSLKGAPKEVGAEFAANNNQLTSLEGAPAIVRGFFSVNNNKLTSLKDVHKYIKEIDGGWFYCERNPLESHVLGLMKIKGLKIVFLDNQEVAEILNSLLPGGSVLDAQSALLDAGLDDWAQL